MIKKSYVDTTAGQVHIRSAGTGEAVLLLHWTPSSGRQYEPLMAELSGKDYHLIAPDLIGYGRSDHKEEVWYIEDFAKNISEVLTALNVDSVRAVGGHVSAEIATQLALTDTRVSQLVLDGCPVWSREEREQILSSAITEAPAAEGEGELPVWAWKKHLWLMKMWNPEFMLESSPAGPFLGAFIDYLETGFDTSGAETLRAYDFDEALSRVKTSTLVVTATTDPLTNCFSKTLDLVLNSRGFTFDGPHPLHAPVRIKEYADLLDAFFQGHELPEDQAPSNSDSTGSYV